MIATSATATTAAVTILKQHDNGNDVKNLTIDAFRSTVTLAALVVCFHATSAHLTGQRKW